jgi:hypothetical protein
MPFTLTPAEFDSATHQTRRDAFMQYSPEAFYAAFKLAGGKLPVGRPMKDHGPIVDRALVVTPSLARATLSVLQRQAFSAPMVSGPGIPSDWDDVPTPPQAAASTESAPVVENLAPVWKAIDTLTNELQTVNSGVETLTRSQRAEGNRLLALAEKVEALEKRAPVQFVVRGVESPIVEGQHYLFPEMVQWLEMGFHALLVGPASSGKTSAAFAFAKMKGLPLYSQMQTVDSIGVVGYLNFQGERIETDFTKAWMNGGVYLIDEMSTNGSDALACLNAALANRKTTIPGLGILEQHPDFYCIAGDNSDRGATIEYSARQLLDGATLDRFIRLQWEIDPVIEAALCPDYPDWLSCIRGIRAFIKDRQIAHVGATVRSLIQGATALRAGALGRDRILEATCAKGILRDEWPAILNLPAVRAFLKG